MFPSNHRPGVCHGPEFRKNLYISEIHFAPQLRDGIVKTRPCSSVLSQHRDRRWCKDKGQPVGRLKASKPKLHDYLLTLGQDVPDLGRGIHRRFPRSHNPVREVLMKFLLDLYLLARLNGARYHGARTKLSDSISRSTTTGQRSFTRANLFRLPMCEPPPKVAPDWPSPAEKPIGLTVSVARRTWIADDLSMFFHIFEYMARHALLQWWKQVLLSRT